MDFLNSGIPLGQYWGIVVRLHFTFLIYAFWQAYRYGNIVYGIAWVVGLYVCILLHEFGHALAARWCDGEANEILLWPLGGLAYCRPAFNPTAHLITTVAGPFVTLVLWLMFWGLTFVFPHPKSPLISPSFVSMFVRDMTVLNLVLFLFNVCVPAFPMDGGRILRDTLWHWMSAEKATRIAILVSRAIAVAGIAWAAYSRNYWLIFLALFIFMQCVHEQQIVDFEGRGTYQFSVRERLSRGRRQRAFRQAVRSRTEADASEAFHRCASCGRTEQDSSDLEFRVCSDCAHGEEYCQEHLETHRHI